MSHSTDISQFQRAMQAADDAAPESGGGVMEADRRKGERQVATFRTCCVVIDGEAHPAILRNMSPGGAMFEALVSARPDMHLTYWWDGIEEVTARVAWVDGTRIGVANLSGPAERIDVPRPRATRVPVRLPVRVWSGLRACRAEMADISMSGIAVQGLDGIAPGALCTIEIGGQTLHNASVVRTEGGITGIRFERPMPPARLMQLIEGGGDHAQLIGKTGVAAKPQPQAQSQPDQATGQDDTPAPAPVRRFL